MRYAEVFMVEDGKFGKKFVPTESWDPAMAGYVVANRIEELELNYAKGWKGTEVSFLRDLEHLKVLTIIDWNIEDVSAIHALHSLRCLEVSTYCKTEIDFGQFPHLEDCGLEWRPKASSIFACRTLKRLYLNRYKGRDTEKFSGLTELESLTLANGPIADLHGLTTLRKLKHLALYNLRKLRSLAGIEALRRLEDLDVHGCSAIGSIAQVAELTDLVRIAICNCGPIESLKPLEGLTKLEAVIFYESTNVLDGDLSPLNRLPRLERVAFQQRRHYSHTRADFAFLGSR